MSASKDASLTAMLGAVSSAARIPFAGLPSVQPCTFIIASSGYVFGPIRGFVVGVLTAIVSGFFFGIGPWTLFQILAWGLAGVLYGLLGKLLKGSSSRPAILFLASVGFLYGYVFGFIMNLWYLLAFGFPITLKTIVALQISSFWMDTMHGAANAAFFIIFGRRVINILSRFKQRLFLTQGSK